MERQTHFLSSEYKKVICIFQVISVLKTLLYIQYIETVDVKVFTWKTVSNAMGKVLKFVGGVPSSKLNCPPNSCMPSRAKIRMNRKRRNSRDMMDLIEFRRDITRFRSDDQYFVTWNEG